METTRRRQGGRALTKKAPNAVRWNVRSNKCDVHESGEGFGRPYKYGIRSAGTKINGTKSEVGRGIACKTRGGLHKEHLVLSRGRWVSKAKHDAMAEKYEAGALPAIALNAKRMQNPKIKKAWAQEMKAARQQAKKEKA